MKTPKSKETKITPTRFVSIRLTDSEFKLLKDESLNTHNTLNTVVRNLIKNYIKKDNQVISVESFDTNVFDESIICKAFIDVFSKKMVSDKPLSDKQLLTLIDYFISMDS